MRASLLAALAVFAVAGVAQAADMAFELRGNGGNCAGCEWVAGEGEITPGTPERFASFVREMDKGGGHVRLTLYLDSPGGRTQPAIRLGEAIRRAGYSTAVGKTIPTPETRNHETAPGRCVGACAIAFLGGVSRTAQPGELALTNPLDESGSQDGGSVGEAYRVTRAGALAAELISFVHASGVDARFGAWALNTAPGGPRSLTGPEIAETRLAFQADAFEPWAIEPYGAGLVAFSKTRDGSTTATLFCAADRQPRLLLATSADRGELDGLKAAIAELSGLDLLGQTVPGRSVSTRLVNGHPAIEVRLKPFEPGLLGKARDIGMSAANHAAHFAWPLFAYPFAKQNAVPSAALALRNCV
jgi:hypothetical protein